MIETCRAPVSDDFKSIRYLLLYNLFLILKYGKIGIYSPWLHYCSGFFKFIIEKEIDSLFAVNQSFFQGHTICVKWFSTSGETDTKIFHNNIFILL